MNINKLVLSGKICNIPVRKLSPGGIPHCHFMLEHHSEQKEAGFNRKVWCKMIIIVSGQKLQKFTHSIRIGCQISVVGFINTHKKANGINELALHAEQIKLTDLEN